MKIHALRLAAIIAIALGAIAQPARADAFKGGPLPASAMALPPLPTQPPLSLPPAEAQRPSKLPDKSPGVAWPSADPRGLPPEAIQAATILPGAPGQLVAAPRVEAEGSVLAAISMDPEGGRILVGDRWMREGEKIPGRARGMIVAICRDQAILDTGEEARVGQAFPAVAPKVSKAKKPQGAPTCP